MDSWGASKISGSLLLKKVKKRIVKAYIIGKNALFFKKQISKSVPFCISNNMQNAINNIYKDLKYSQKTRKTILLSPAAASFDQFSNFENRGNYFKNLIINILKAKVILKIWLLHIE